MPRLAWPTRSPSPWVPHWCPFCVSVPQLGVLFPSGNGVPPAVTQGQFLGPMPSLPPTPLAESALAGQQALPHQRAPGVRGKARREPAWRWGWCLGGPGTSHAQHSSSVLPEPRGLTGERDLVRTSPRPHRPSQALSTVLPPSFSRFVEWPRQVRCLAGAGDTTANKASIDPCTRGLLFQRSGRPRHSNDTTSLSLRWLPTSRAKLGVG